MPKLECPFSDLVLLKMMIATQAHAPFVGGLEAETTVGTGAHMRALNR